MDGRGEYPSGTGLSVAVLAGVGRRRGLDGFEGMSYILSEHETQRLFRGILGLAERAGSDGKLGVRWGVRVAQMMMPKETCRPGRSAGDGSRCGRVCDAGRAAGPEAAAWLRDRAGGGRSQGVGGGGEVRVRVVVWVMRKMPRPERTPGVEGPTDVLTFDWENSTGGDAWATSFLEVDHLVLLDEAARQAGAARGSRCMERELLLYCIQGVAIALPGGLRP